MDTHLSGSQELLEIKKEGFTLHLFGEDIGRLRHNRQLNQGVSGAVRLWPKTEDVALRTISSSGELVNNSGSQMKPVFFEDGTYELVIESDDPQLNLTLIQNGININKYFKQVNNITLGSLKFKSDVGYTNLDIYADNEKVISLLIEVFPSKMDYYKDYKAMISEINEEIASIAFRMLDKTYLESELVDTKHQTQSEFINILDHIFSDFEDSLKFIVSNFRHNIIEHEKVVPIHKAKRISRKTRKHLRTKPYLLQEADNGFIEVGQKRYMPRTVIEIRKETTIDIFENQMVKYIIRQVIKRIETLENILGTHNSLEYKESINNRYQLGHKKKVLNTYLEKHFKKISDIMPRNSMSLVFQMSPGYKDAYKRYKILSKGLDLGDDLFKITPKKIYELYEMWCYVKLHQILYDLGYGVKDYGIIGHRDNGLYLKLNTDIETAMIYQKDDQALRLWYNKNYSVPTTNQRPDTVLYIENLSSDQKRTYIFDAKYRLKVDPDGTQGPMEADINVMHRYRDAIVSQLDDGFKYKYETFGAYVMFPCSDEAAFKNHRFYKSIEEINIGAFPMLPGASGLITEHLKKILGQSDLEAKDDLLVLDEFDDYAKFKREDVMVVNSKDPDHLEAYLHHRFYHIPKKHLAHVSLGVEYLAFYQPITSFKEDAGIFHYAKIQNVRQYKRKDCKELPPSRRNKEIYLRFDLGEIMSVNKVKPIQIAPRLLSYTTLYLLHNAENMHELKIKNNLEMRVYKILNRISKEQGVKVQKRHEKYEIGNSVVEIIEGKTIRVDGKIVGLRDLKDDIIKVCVEEVYFYAGKYRTNKKESL